MAILFTYLMQIGISRDDQAMQALMARCAVAEGVETAAQHDYLCAQKCELFQGFLCAPALPVADFEALIKGLPQWA